MKFRHVIMTAFILGFGVSFMAGCFPAGSGSEKTTDFPIAKIDGDVSVVFFRAVQPPC